MGSCGQSRACAGTLTHETSLYRALLVQTGVLIGAGIAVVRLLG